MTQRNLTGMFFRTLNKEQGKWISVCFEELPKDQRDAILFEKDGQFKDRMIEVLVNTINEIGELTDLVRGGEDEDEKEE